MVMTVFNPFTHWKSKETSRAQSLTPIEVAEPGFNLLTPMPMSSSRSQHGMGRRVEGKNHGYKSQATSLQTKLRGALQHDEEVCVTLTPDHLGGETWLQSL